MKSELQYFENPYFKRIFSQIGFKKNMGKKLENLICVVISFLMIFTLPTVYYVSMANVYSLLAIGCEGMILLYLFGKNYKHIKCELLFWITMYLILAFIYSVINISSFGCLKILLIFLPFCICFFHCIDVRRFADIYVKVAVIFSFVFLISWFAVILGFLKPKGSFIMDWGIEVKVIQYHPLYFNAQRGRNTAIFTEGPVANYFFCTSVLINEFFSEKDKSTSLFRGILLLSVLSTGTTTGLIFILAYSVYYFFFVFQRNSRYSSIYKCLIIFLLPFAAAVLINFSGGLLENKLESKSGQVRMLMITKELEAFSQHIFTGNGFSSYSDGSSNSFTSLLADGGILLWFLFYYPIIANIVRGLRKRTEECLFSILFLVVFTVSVFQYTLFTCVVLGILYNKLIETNKIRVVL